MVSKTISLECHTRCTVFSRYLFLHTHQQEWYQLFISVFIAFFLCTLYYDRICWYHQSVMISIQLCVHSTGVGYQHFPALVVAVYSASNHHHQCLHLHATTPCLQRWCSASVSIILCLHFWPLSLCCISVTSDVSKSSTHTFFLPGASVLWSYCTPLICSTSIIIAIILYRVHMCLFLFFLHFRII